MSRISDTTPVIGHRRPWRVHPSSLGMKKNSPDIFTTLSFGTTADEYRLTRAYLNNIQIASHVIVGTIESWWTPMCITLLDCKSIYKRGSSSSTAAAQELPCVIGILLSCVPPSSAVRKIWKLISHLKARMQLDLTPNLVLKITMTFDRRKSNLCCLLRLLISSIAVNLHACFVAKLGLNLG